MTTASLCRHCRRPRWPTHGKTFGRCLSPDGKVWRTFEADDVELRPCSCADPEHCRQPVPGYVCKAGLVTK